MNVPNAMVKNAHILVDTCILSNLLSKEVGLAKETTILVEALTANGNKLYVSEYSYYELLRSATPEQRKKCESLLEGFAIIPHSRERLERAVILYSRYKEKMDVKQRVNSVSDIDIFIGSLIFTDKGTYLLTADFNDFPRPIFYEEEVHRIEFVRKNTQKVCFYYYILGANLDEF